MPNSAELPPRAMKRLCVAPCPEDPFSATARLGAARVGHCWGGLDEDEHSLKISDLFVEPEVEAWRCWEQRWLSRRLRKLVDRREWSLRKLHTGSRLLELVLDAARRHGVKRVRGTITKEAYKSQDWLLPFYQRRGFERVKATDPFLKESAECGIEMRLL